jgi:putative hydrolase of the HAD superfamily
MTVRVILFDLGDTLFRLHPMRDVLVALTETLARETGLPEAQAAEVCARALESHRAEARNSWQSGQTGEPPLDAVLYRHFQPHVSLSPLAAEALAEVYWRADVARFEATADCASRVEAFRAAGYRLAAVSNTSTRAAMLDAYLETVGLRPLFAAVVYSCELGLRKPHAAIYREALRRLGAPAEEAIFVGDRVREDVLGPQAVGIRAVLTHEFRQEDPALSRPVGVVKRLDDLDALLRALPSN